MNAINKLYLFIGLLLTASAFLCTGIEVKADDTASRFSSSSSSGGGASSGPAVRKFGPFLGAGLSYLTSKVTQTGVSAAFTGYNYNVELGVDVPFTNSFGLTLGYEIGEMLLQNNYQTDNYLDQTTARTNGFRASFFLKKVYFGGGSRATTLTAHAISVSSGASTNTFEGKYNYGMLGYSFDHQDILRVSCEVNVGSFEMSKYKYSDYQVGLRLYILPALLTK